VVDALSALRMACKNPHDLGIPENMAHALKAAKVSGAGHLLKQKYAEFLSDYFFAKIA
jgi:hypothetical protein